MFEKSWNFDAYNRSDIFRWSLKSKKSSETILGIILENPRITVKDLSQLTGLSVGGVRWNLDKLAEKGKLKRVGPDKGGYWEVINKE